MFIVRSRKKHGTHRAGYFWPARQAPSIQDVRGTATAQPTVVHVPRFGHPCSEKGTHWPRVLLRPFTFPLLRHVETGAKKPGLYARCRASPPCGRSVRGAYSYLAERTSQSSPHQPEHELRCVEPLRCRDHRVTPVCDAVPGLRIAIVGSWAPNTGSTAFRPARGDGLRCDRGDIVASGNSDDGGCGGSARHPLPHIEAHYVLWLLAGHGIVCWGPPCGTRQGLCLWTNGSDPHRFSKGTSNSSGS